MDIKQLGPYRVGRVLGRGGMGTVYLGEHETTQRVVAIKVLTPNFARDETFRERFEAEVHSLEKLRHPHIVELLGFGEQYGYLFFAMEYVEGTTLQQELSAGRRFHWREVLRYGIEICSALKHAHDHGVIHRDIKPANLLLTVDDQIKLTDFGIAKLFGNSQMTADGGVLGTADYMSPEQAEGLKVTTRCDLYSVGAVLYALLAGAPPFQGRSLPEVVHKVRFEHPLPIGRLVVDVPREMEVLVDQLLSKNPMDRVPTALAVANRLQAIQHALSVQRTEQEQAEAEKHIQPETESVTWIRPTSGPSEPEIANRPTALHSDTPPRVPRTLNTMETQVPSPPQAAKESAISANRPEQPQPSIYVSVDEEYRRRKQRAPEPEEAKHELILKWGGAIGLLSLFTLLGWFLLRPPTADALYHEITESLDRYGTDGIVQVEEEIGEFLRRFPDESRVAEVQELGQTLELAKLERRLRMRARYDTASESRSPLEISMVRILYLERSDPQAAAKQLRALLDVFGQDSQLSERDQECVTLATQWLDRIEPTLQRVNTALREKIRQRLVYANQVRGKEPARAQEIWRGIVELYGDQEWAADLVREARGNLSR
jgi:serine/threonine-protein kinase